MMEKRKVTGVRMPKELDKKISDAACYLGTTKNGLIIQILWEYVNERGKHEQFIKDQRRPDAINAPST